MTVKLSELEQGKTTFELDLGAGKKCPITYDPSILTGEFVGTMEKAQYSEEVYGYMAELLHEIDVTDENDKKIPCTAEGLMRLPIKFIRKIWQGILKDTSTSGEAPRPSGGGSRRGAKGRR